MSKSKKQNKTKAQEARDYIISHLADKNIVIIPAEKTHVRRTKDEFEAGATPLSQTSYRMKKIGVLATPEVIQAVDASAARSGVKQSQWMRAAIRKALREGVDVDFELETPIEVAAPDPSDTTS